METLDKEKILIWLKELAEFNALSQAYYAFDVTIKEIKKGTFDCVSKEK